MVFALLIAAIIWNLGTWYLGLPPSSSHTLIGSIMGVGLANSMLDGGHEFGERRRLGARPRNVGAVAAHLAHRRLRLRCAAAAVWPSS